MSAERHIRVKLMCNALNCKEPPLVMLVPSLSGRDALAKISKAIGLTGATNTIKKIRMPGPFQEIDLDGRTVGEMGFLNGSYHVTVGRSCPKRSSALEAEPKMKTAVAHMEKIQRKEKRQKHNQKAAKEQVSGAFKGTGVVLKSGEMCGVPLKPMTDSKLTGDVKMDGPGIRLADGEVIAPQVEYLRSEHRQFIESLEEYKRNGGLYDVGSDVQELMDGFSKGHLRGPLRGHFAERLDMHNQADDERRVLTCLSEGTYSIERGSATLNILGEGGRKGSSWEGHDVFTIKFHQPKGVRNLFNKTGAFEFPAILFPNYAHLQDFLEYFHKEATKEGDWSNLEPRYLICYLPTVFWSMVYVSNIMSSTRLNGDGCDFTVEGKKSLRFMYRELLEFMQPNLDWSEVSSSWSGVDNWSSVNKAPE